MGAVLALMLFHTQFDIIGMIGVLLLIGIVKKNAILMIDFALDAERQRGLSSTDAIYEACLIRFRPIMMTTMAALFAAVPLMVGMGEGSEFRQPLGIAIFGGLIVSQILTLYTTPIVYLYLDRLRHRGGNASFLFGLAGCFEEDVVVRRVRCRLSGISALDFRQSYRGSDVLETLERGATRVSDIGSEFVSKELDLWAYGAR